ncbi:MAG TPA: DUF1345 domain-containing protein [Bryobacteraceae bacterium]|jgi:uncharacterized membrane protein|nr:DUF1345 domain-containing protein [Bryobacteraceae bacterium]
MMAVLSVAGLYWALPESLVPGPGWLTLAIVAPLLIAAVTLHRQAKYSLNQIVGYALLIVITLATITALVLLVTALPDRKQNPRDLLHSAVALWFSNVLVFASWYWRLDAGGPNQRDLRGEHTEGAFLFPQMTLGDRDWKPGFMDYLFLAFNTSTAFSPTDVPVLSRWAKAMMMVQSAISLSTLALLAARAVNIL